jgi:transcription initiation factor TFIID subunit 2
LTLAEILNVKVNSHVASFLHHDPLTNLTISKPDDFRGYPELKRKLYSALSESDEGELSIAIPSQVSITTAGPTDNQTGASTSANTSSQASREYLPITVRIEYALRDPVDGLQFVLPSDAYPFVRMHPY